MFIIHSEFSAFGVYPSDAGVRNTSLCFADYAGEITSSISARFESFHAKQYFAVLRVSILIEAI